MTLRHLIPGPPLAKVVNEPELEGEGQWKLRGLPQHGFPYALALTELRPDVARPTLKVRILQLDPRMVTATPSAAHSAGNTVAVVDAGAAPSGHMISLWHSDGAFSIGSTPPVPDAVRIVSGEPRRADATAALGVSDEGGMMIYAELVPQPATPVVRDPAATPQSPPLPNGKMLEDLLMKLGCSARLLSARPIAIALGGDTDLTGAAVRAASGLGAVQLLRAEGAGAQEDLRTPRWCPTTSGIRFSKSESDTSRSPTTKRLQARTRTTKGNASTYPSYMCVPSN